MRERTLPHAQTGCPDGRQYFPQHHTVFMPHIIISEQKTIRFFGAYLPAELRQATLPCASKAALAALSAAKSVPEKLRSTCQRDRIGAGTKDDESGLAPAEEDDTASADYSRWQAYWLLFTDDIPSAVQGA